MEQKEVHLRKPYDLYVNRFDINKPKTQWKRPRSSQPTGATVTADKSGQTATSASYDMIISSASFNEITATIESECRRGTTLQARRTQDDFRPIVMSQSSIIRMAHPVQEVVHKLAIAVTQIPLALQIRLQFQRVLLAGRKACRTSRQ